MGTGVRRMCVGGTFCRGRRAGRRHRHRPKLQPLTNPWSVWNQHCWVGCVRARASIGKIYGLCLFFNTFLSPTHSKNDREEEARPSGAVGRSGREKVFDSDSIWEA